MIWVIMDKNHSIQVDFNVMQVYARNRLFFIKRNNGIWFWKSPTSNWIEAKTSKPLEHAYKDWITNTIILNIPE